MLPQTFRVLASPFPPRSQKPLQIRNPSFLAWLSSIATVVLSFYLKMLALHLFFRYDYLCLCYASLFLHLLPSSSVLLLHLRQQCFAGLHPGPSSTFCILFFLFSARFFSLFVLSVFFVGPASLFFFSSSSTARCRGPLFCSLPFFSLYLVIK